jgi:hypothetical protein
MKGRKVVLEGVAEVSCPEDGLETGLGRLFFPRLGEVIALPPPKKFPFAPPPILHRAAFRQRSHETFNLLLKMAKARRQELSRDRNL